MKTGESFAFCISRGLDVKPLFPPGPWASCCKLQAWESGRLIGRGRNSAASSFSSPSCFPRDQECISKVLTLAMVWHHSKLEVLLCGNSLSWAICNCVDSSMCPTGAACGGHRCLPAPHPCQGRALCLCFGSLRLCLVSMLLVPHPLPASYLWRGPDNPPVHIRLCSQTSVGTIHKLTFQGDCAGVGLLPSDCVSHFLPLPLSCWYPWG